MLTAGKSHYVPSLGLSEHLAEIKYHGEFDVDAGPQGESVAVDSAVPERGRRYRSRCGHTLSDRRITGVYAGRFRWPDDNRIHDLRVQSGCEPTDGCRYRDCSCRRADRGVRLMASRYSHPPENGHDGVELVDHLEDVARRVREIVPVDAETPDGESLPDVVEILAYVHDFGKATTFFQSICSIRQSRISKSTDTMHQSARLRPTTRLMLRVRNRDLFGGFRCGRQTPRSTHGCRKIHSRPFVPSQKRLSRFVQ